MNVPISSIEYEIYSSVVQEVAEQKPEVAKQIYEAPKMLAYDMPPEVIGAVPDYEKAPWLKKQLGYEKPPMYFNPRYAHILPAYDLMAVVYHEAVHEAQMDGDAINDILDKYVEFDNELHRELFYELREKLMQLPLIRDMLIEGEAQYLTRKAFPYASREVMTYSEEEKMYLDLIETSRKAARLKENPEMVLVYVILPSESKCKYAS